MLRKKKKKIRLRARLRTENSKRKSTVHTAEPYIIKKVFFFKKEKENPMCVGNLKKKKKEIAVLQNRTF